MDIISIYLFMVVVLGAITSILIALYPTIPPRTPGLDVNNVVTKCLDLEVAIHSTHSLQ